ncbi:hypothetical protein [Ensifer sp. ENS11]|uniref:hypothetical protein n=1 Tax=Ensifer sp. ENS11 TaxID=2769291 RepID=UPI00178191F1|nr:hypothetical protein [Ensifer sp. ENS11]MBD9492241.1 hypothetical protein [Ensifer sp. ENS11]
MAHPAVGAFDGDRLDLGSSLSALEVAAEIGGTTGVRVLADPQLTTPLRTFTGTKVFVATFYTLSFLDSKFSYLNYSNRVLWIPVLTFTV